MKAWARATSAEAPLPAGVKTALLALASERFGLSRIGNDGALAHRVSQLIEAAGPNESPTSIVRRLKDSPTGDPLWLAAADVLPNHETSFFRDAAQLCGFVDAVAPALIQRRSGGTVRILSAGCATGEELYSLAMLLMDSLHVLWGERLELVGIDVSPRAIAHARRAHFAASTVARAGKGPAKWSSRFFRGEDGAITARSWLRSAVRFEVANLVDAPSLERLGEFDAILCRNVLIYFGAAAIDGALASLWSRLRPGGALVLGRTEVALGARLGGVSCQAGELLWQEREESR